MLIIAAAIGGGIVGAALGATKVAGAIAAVGVVLGVVGARSGSRSGLSIGGASSSWRASHGQMVSTSTYKAASGTGSRAVGDGEAVGLPDHQRLDLGRARLVLLPDEQGKLDRHQRCPTRRPKARSSPSAGVLAGGLTDPAQIIVTGDMQSPQAQTAIKDLQAEIAENPSSPADPGDAVQGRLGRSR